MEQAPTTSVVIGMGPHKRSVTIEVMTADETVLDRGRFDTDERGFAALLERAGRWPSRVWAVEGCNGIGRHVATRLVAAGEQVLDVPPKLSARVRTFATGQGRKTDATDAHSVALVGTRMSGLRPVVPDTQREILRILVDRRRAIGDEHTVKVNQLHSLLLELVPGGAKRDLSAAQAHKILASVRPRDVVGKTRKRVAAELVADLERLYARKKAANKELTALLRECGTTLTQLHGIGPSGAARLIVEVGDVTRFPNAGHFASWTGTAPSTPPPATTSATASAAAGTARSTGPCTSWPWSSSATAPKAAPTTTARSPPARPPTKPCAASNDACPTSCTERCSTTSPTARRRAREGNEVATLTPARPAHNPTPALRTSHFPDPSQPRLRLPSSGLLDTEGSHER